MRAEFTEIGAKLQKMADQELDFVICVMPSENCEHIYKAIKFAGDLTVGIPTHCIQSNTFSNGTEFRDSYLLNLNAKMDGVNQKLSNAPILRDFDTVPVMFIGAHVAVPEPTAAGQNRSPRYVHICI